MAAFKLSDIAENLGLNISTVSRALAGDARVREETRRRVREEAQRLGYRPNVAARALAMGRSGVVWFIIPGLENPVEREPALHAGRHLFKCGYDLHIVQHHDDLAVYSRVMDRLAGGGADAAIIIPPPDADGRDEAEVLRAGVPLAYLDRDLPGVPVPTVSTDNEGAVLALLTELFPAAEARGPVLVVDCFNAKKNGVEAARARGLHAACDALVDTEDSSLRIYGTGPNLEPGAFGAIVIAASSQGAALRCRSDLSARLEGTTGEGPSFFALVFDYWQPGTDEFQKIAYAVQDFRSMAETASEAILDSLRRKENAEVGQDSSRSTVLIPLLRIVSVDRS